MVGVILSPWTLALDIWKCPDRCLSVYALGYHKESLIALELGCGLGVKRAVERAHKSILFCSVVDVPVIAIFKSHDIVLFEVAPGLNFDHLKRHGTWIFQSVADSYGNVC